MSTTKLNSLAEQARQKEFDPSQHADNSIALALHRILHDDVLWAGICAIYVEKGMLFQRALRGYLHDFLKL